MQILHPEETGEKGQKESGRTAAYEAYGEEMEGRGLFSFEDLLLEDGPAIKGVSGRERMAEAVRAFADR